MFRIVFPFFNCYTYHFLQLLLRITSLRSRSKLIIKENTCTCQLLRYSFNWKVYPPAIIFCSECSTRTSKSFLNLTKRWTSIMVLMITIVTVKLKTYSISTYLSAYTMRITIETSFALRTGIEILTFFTIICAWFALPDIMPHVSAWRTILTIYSIPKTIPTYTYTFSVVI